MHFRPRCVCVVIFICVWKRRCADVRAGTQAPPLRFRLGGLHVNGYFVCVERFCKVSNIVAENVRYWVAICA